MHVGVVCCSWQVGGWRWHAECPWNVSGGQHATRHLSCGDQAPGGPLGGVTRLLVAPGHSPPSGPLERPWRALLVLAP